ncbi:MAG: peptidylprolyl isomerase [Verrucomicrobia bacterium]|nr:peptidylprolyl isomerase [Verrucomicrobiota bacterium]
MRKSTAPLLLFLTLSHSLFAATDVPTVQTPLANTSVPMNTGIPATDLTTTFTVPGVTNAIVQMQMAWGTANKGTVNIQMAPASAPNTVTNFLNYVNAGTYTNTVVHRSIVGTPPAGFSIIQGGEFQWPAFGTVATNAPINMEFSLANTRGTIAMARTSALNSATSGWFFNVIDNTGVFNSGNQYAAFGTVIGSGMTVVDAVNALPTYNATSLNAAFTNYPLSGYTNPPGYVNANSVRVTNASVVPLFPTTLVVDVTSSSTTSNIVTVSNPPVGFQVGAAFLGTKVTAIAGNQVTLLNNADRSISVQTSVSASKAGETSVVSFALANNNPALVTASLAGSSLNLSLKNNRGGFADIAVNATDSNGNTAQSKFRLSVAGGLIPTSVTGDANNDGITDFVFQNGAGQLFEWFLDGTGTTINYATGAGLKPGSKFLYGGGLGDWRLAARADVNNDGIPDLIFQNSAGQLYKWLLDGSGNAINFATGSGLKPGSGFLYTAGLGDRRVVAVADINGDGFPDLIFQNSAGQLYKWLLDGSGNAINFATGSGLKPGSGFLYGGGLSDWRVVAVADINGDGIPDLVSQNSAGQIYKWILDGTGNTINFSTGIGIKPGYGYLYTGGLGDWRILAVADINGDGIPDLIFQNTAGQIYRWHLDGTGTTINYSTGVGLKPGSGFLYSAALGDWRIR